MKHENPTWTADMNGIRAHRWSVSSLIGFVLLTALPAASATPTIYALAIDPLTPTTLYAAESLRILKSTDGGATWSVTSTYGTFTDQGLAVHPLTPTTVYVPGGKTTDGGVTWNPTGPSAPVSVVVVDPRTPTTVYAMPYVCGMDDAGWCYDTEMLKSTDGGTSWSGTGLVAYRLAIDPVSPTTLYAVGSTNPYDPALQGPGLFKSVDGGVTWSLIHEELVGPAIDPVTPTTVYAADGSGRVYKSIDGGSTWGAIGSTGVSLKAFAIDPVNPTTLYGLGAASGVIKSTDGGATWSATGLVFGPPNYFVHPFAIDPLTPATLYAATDAGAFKSTDGGASWHPTGQGVTETPRPTIASVTPSSGPVGTVVTVAGTKLDAVTDVRFFGGATATITSMSGSSLTVRVPAGAATGPVTLNSTLGAVSTATAFTMTPAITGVTPNPAFGGTQVTITGTNLVAATGIPIVRSGSVTASLWPGSTASQLRVTLPLTAATGRVSVTTVDGAATSATDLVVVRRPTVTSFTPAAGPPGTLVSVSGTNLTAVTDVLFAGVSAGLTPVSATLLRATVPDGAARGPITLVTAAGTVASLTAFTVMPPSDLSVTAVVGPAGAAIGRSITVGTTVRNAGGSAASSSVLRLYMSADVTLDAGDRELTTRAVPGLAASATLALTTPATIPADLTPGSYRILALVDAANSVREGNEANNVGMSGPVSITLYRPNLAVTALTPPARGAIGQPITVPNTVRNTGPAPAGPFAVRFHLSTDAALDSGDPVIGLRTLTGLASGGSSATPTVLRLPAAISPGQYHVIAVADALEQQAELDETNKTSVSGPFTVVAYQPELAITAMTVPARGAIGQAIAVANTVRNGGLAPAGPFTVRFHLSSDGVLDPGDPAVGLRSVGGLAAGSASATSTSLKIPATVGVGEYYIVAVVDAAGQQAELDETNNTTASAPFSVVPYRATDGGDPGECGAARALGWVRPAGMSARPGR